MESDAINRSGLVDRLEELIKITKPYAMTTILNMVSPVTGLLYLTSGVAALLGVSGGVEIGFNDEGWDNFTEGV